MIKSNSNSKGLIIGTIHSLLLMVGWAVCCLLAFYGMSTFVGLSI